MRVCDDLQAYLALDREEKLSTYLVEDVAATVRLDERHSPVVDLREMPGASALAFVPDIPNTLMREEAGLRLIAAAEALRERGYVLEVHETYRAYEKQKREFAEIHARIAAEHPELAGKALWRKVTEFIADPDLCPPHATAGATDVRLLTLRGAVVDMGGEINAPTEVSYLLSPDIGPEAMAHRALLLEQMTAQGFAPMPTEWWHYSFGDRYWGAFYGRPAIYPTVH